MEPLTVLVVCGQINAFLYLTVGIISLFRLYVNAPVIIKRRFPAPFWALAFVWIAGFALFTNQIQVPEPSFLSHLIPVCSLSSSNDQSIRNCYLQMRSQGQALLRPTPVRASE